MLQPQRRIVPAQPRESVQVVLTDGRIFEGPRGTPLQAFIEEAFPNAVVPIVAALVNDQVRKLSYPLTSDARVTPMDITTGDGMRIYQRSLSFLMVAAAKELYPDAYLIIDHSLTLSGLYCEVRGRAPFTEEEIQRLEARMWEMVAENAPITKQPMPVEQAIEMFRAQGYDDKVRLLHYRRADVVVYELHGVCDYFYGYMVPSTGYLTYLALQFYPPGWILRFPRRYEPSRLSPFRDSPKLAAVFRNYRRTMELMGVEDVGTLNQVIESSRLREAILVGEALHEHRISEIAEMIANNRGKTRLVLIAGPSASGKTTFSKRLAVQLLVHDVHPLAIAMDDYFLDRDKTPKDEQGNYLFEEMGALDLELFNRQLLDLMAGREVTLPRFNFRSGRREWGDTLRISAEHVILVEGIHGMNPGLVPSIPQEAVLRIYVSCLTQLNIDHHNRIPTTDTRLLRRMVRDAQYRGYTAQQTIHQWEHVRQGEERNIFPYQENADVMFNSALAYELAVLKPFAEPLLRSIEHDSLEFAEARRLLTFLKWFLPYDADSVPDNSILREFIGGSILSDFEPWRHSLGPKPTGQEG